MTPSRNPLPPKHHRRTRARQNGSAPGQEGMMALELLILVPLIIVLLLLVVGLGRYARGRQLVEDASAAAARAASLTGNPTQASSEAGRQAADTLSQAGLSCQPMRVSVDTTAFGPGGQVSVTVRCTADLSDLVMSGLPTQAHLSATSTSALETHRVLSGGFGITDGVSVGNRSGD